MFAFRLKALVRLANPGLTGPRPSARSEHLPVTKGDCSSLHRGSNPLYCKCTLSPTDVLQRESGKLYSWFYAISFICFVNGTSYIGGGTTVMHHHHEERKAILSDQGLREEKNPYSSPRWLPKIKRPFIWVGQRSSCSVWNIRTAFLLLHNFSPCQLVKLVSRAFLTLQASVRSSLVFSHFTISDKTLI